MYRHLTKFRPLFSSLSVFLIAGIAATGTPDVYAEEAFVESVFPPSMQRGVVNRIEISGKSIENVLGVWTSVPNGMTEAQPISNGDGNSVEIDFRIPKDAPLGLFGLRLATKSGLSNPHIFLIDELPTVSISQEASQNVLVQTPVSLPASLSARCRPAEIDRYVIEVAAGERVTLEIIGNRFGKDFDPLVTIRNAAGKMIRQHDNDVGLFFDCRFEQTFSAGGLYTVEVSDARYNGDDTWSYVLRMGDFPAARTAVPGIVVPNKTSNLQLPELNGTSGLVSVAADAPPGLGFRELRTSSNRLPTWIPLEVHGLPAVIEHEPNDDFETATQATTPSAVHGVLEKTGDADWFAIEMIKGQSLRALTEARGIGSAADIELTFFEPGSKPEEPLGRQAQRVDESTVRDQDHNTTFAKEASFDFRARVDGTHYLRVGEMSRAGGAAYTYSVKLDEARPTLAIHANISRCTLPRATFQPIPLKITRSGWDGPIELELIGSPKGVQLETKTIPEKVTEFVCRVVASADAELGYTTLQLVGTGKKDDQKLTAIATTHPLVDVQLRNKDRILYALRADQRRLPPSLTNRIALMVTAPSPFDFELPEQELPLTNYLSTTFPIATTRRNGFNSPITFTASGGQLGPEEEERIQLFARFPAAQTNQPTVDGEIFTRNRTAIRKDRIDVTATAEHEGHSVSLTRTFMLDIRSAFNPTFEPATLELLPGEKGKVKLLANRLDEYDGEIHLEVPRPVGTIDYPETIEIPSGQKEVELEIQVPADANPTRYQVRYESRGFIGKYQQLLRSPILNVTVKKPPKEK